LTIRQTALGSTHVLTAESLNNLALLYAAQGNAAAAEPLYKQAIAILEQTEFPVHNPFQMPAVRPVDPQPGAPPRGDPQRGGLARVLDNYAALLHDTGRDAEADTLEARVRTLHAGEGSEK
jgi:tetratricopeptide (TPR) repeat protein